MKKLLIAAAMIVGVVVATGSAQSHRARRPSTTTITVRCTYQAVPSSVLGRVSGVEVFGARQHLPDISMDTSCTDVYNQLSAAGFEILQSFSLTATSAGPVSDGDDLVLWQRNSGSIP